MNTSSNSTINLLKSTHSVRKFSNKPISKDLLEQILACSIKAPNASNRQNYSIIVISDPEILKKFFYGSTLGLLFCVDYNRIIKVAEHMGHKYDVYEIFSFLSGTIDTMLATQNAVIAATSLGIGSLLTNSIHRVPISEIYEMFNLPHEHCFPLLSLCLGYSEESPKTHRGRYQGPGLIHYGQYHIPTAEECDQIVKDYDDQEKQIGSNYTHGMDHFLDWFYTKWSAGRYNQAKIDEFYQILSRAKFLKKCEN
jgi:nitroreductase